MENCYAINNKLLRYYYKNCKENSIKCVIIAGSPKHSQVVGCAPPLWADPVCLQRQAGEHSSGWRARHRPLLPSLRFTHCRQVPNWGQSNPHPGPAETRHLLLGQRSSSTSRCWTYLPRVCQVCQVETYSDHSLVLTDYLLRVFKIYTGNSLHRDLLLNLLRPHTNSLLTQKH